LQRQHHPFVGILLFAKKQLKTVCCLPPGGLAGNRRRKRQVQQDRYDPDGTASYATTFGFRIKWLQYFIKLVN
jgi:hypothetical protein